MHCKISDCLKCPYPDCINDYVPKELTPEQREKKHIRDREWRKKKHAECIEKSICTICFKRPATKGYKTCSECRTRTSRQRKERYRTATNCTPRFFFDGTNLCSRCGKRPPMEGHKICEHCYSRNKSPFPLKNNQNKAFRVEIDGFWSGYKKHD